MSDRPSTGTFRDSFGRLLDHVSARRKRQLGLLLVLTLMGAAAELLSLGAVIPFVAVLADPGAAAGHPSVAALMAMFHIQPSQLPVAVSLLFAGLVVVAMAIRLLMMWANIRFANGLGTEIGEMLYARTLQRPYSFHVSRNTSQIIGSMNKVQRLIVGYLQPLLTGVTAAILALAIIALLIAVNPAVAIGGATIFGSSYFLVAFLVRKRLRRDGIIIARANDQRIQAMQEGLGGIRDVILDNAQAIYSGRFARIEQRFRRAQAGSQFAAGFPRVAIEAIGILLLVGFALLLAKTGRDLRTMLPLLGLIAIGAQKLIPLLQQIYAGWSAVTGSQRSVDDVLGLLDFEPLPRSCEALAFDHVIEFDDVGFAYGNPEGRCVLHGIRLQIRRGEKIGIVGPTGSGKSTLVDLLMGLLSPTTGRFCVDGVEITLANAAGWQEHIAHVPQAIFLSDATIGENIAFGHDPKRIDTARMEAAARAAQIHEHVVSLPDGYRTMVGERGVRLSGGQRQRIGIARALYKGADVLVLDEATSALDDDTERHVMEGIGAIAADTTVIMIAHRLTTMRDCDRIIRLAGGRVAGITDYAGLMAGLGAPPTPDVAGIEESR